VYKRQVYMTIIAVITGDLVNSMSVDDSASFRRRLQALLRTVETTYGAVTSMYRGDGFQLALPAATDAYEVAILMRAGLIAGNEAGSDRWDARVAIAVGLTDEPVTDANSPVHVSSGRTLDALDKDRLGIVFDEQGAGLQVMASLAALFMDDIVNGWTAREAEILRDYLTHRDAQQKIADRMGVSRPTVTLALQRAKSKLVDAYIRDMKAMTEAAYGERRG